MLPRPPLDPPMCHVIKSHCTDVVFTGWTDNYWLYLCSIVCIVQEVHKLNYQLSFIEKCNPSLTCGLDTHDRTGFNQICVNKV